MKQTIIVSGHRATRRVVRSAVKAVDLQKHLANTPGAPLLTVAQCVEVVAFCDGFADDVQRRNDVWRAAEQIKVDGA